MAIFLAFPALAQTSVRDANMPLWQSIVDYEEKHAFENYGPPMRENVFKFEREQKLYEDMVQYFDETAEDEPDFIFVVEAYSVGIDVFRPSVIRPEGEAIKEGENNPFGEDDPLPESVKSTSAYVEEVRPTFLPGKPLRMRPLSDIKLGEEQMGSLFTDSEKLKKETNPPPVKTEDGKTVPAEAAGPPVPPGDRPVAGAIDMPKKKPEPAPVGPAPGSDEETLDNLKKAVKELGLERQLNFDGSMQALEPGDASGNTTSPVPDQAVGPPMPAAAQPAPPSVAPPKPAVRKAIPKTTSKSVKKPAAKKPSSKKPSSKKKPAKKAVKKSPARKKMPKVDVPAFTPPAPAQAPKAPGKELSGEELGKVKQNPAD